MAKVSASWEGGFLGSRVLGACMLEACLLRTCMLAVCMLKVHMLGICLLGARVLEARVLVARPRTLRRVLLTWGAVKAQAIKHVHQRHESPYFGRILTLVYMFFVRRGMRAASMRCAQQSTRATSRALHSTRCAAAHVCLRPAGHMRRCARRKTHAVVSGGRVRPYCSVASSCAHQRRVTKRRSSFCAR